MKCRILLLVALIALAATKNNADAQSVTDPPSVFGPNFTISNVAGPRSLCMSREGRQGCVNFGGDKVTYTGDLPFDDAAKVFFDHVGFLRAECKK